MITDDINQANEIPLLHVELSSLREVTVDCCVTVPLVFLHTDSCHLHLVNK